MIPSASWIQNPKYSTTDIPGIRCQDQHLLLRIDSLSIQALGEIEIGKFGPRLCINGTKFEQG